MEETNVQTQPADETQKENTVATAAESTEEVKTEGAAEATEPAAEGESAGEAPATDADTPVDETQATSDDDAKASPHAG